jgi:CheY-like chemotaxis protein
MLPEVVGHGLAETHGADCPVGYAGARRSILIVDDDFEQRSFLDRWLAAIGFTVTAVPNGEAAVELSRRGAFDLALLDISLPGISGWQTAAELRARYGDAIRIVMVSANAHEAHRPTSPEGPHNHFLLKPFAFDALIQALGSLLGLTWHHQAAPADAASRERAPSRDLPLSSAARVHAERIRELLRIGYIRGIEGEIRQLAVQAPELSELIDRLYAHLDRFDLGGMAKILENI